MPPQEPVNKKFCEFLNELKQTADQNGQKNYYFALNKAYNNLKSTPNALSPYQLVSVSGIGPNIQTKIIAMTNKFLSDGRKQVHDLYRSDVQNVPPYDPSGQDTSGSSQGSSENLSQSVAQTKQKKTSRKRGKKSSDILNELEDATVGHSFGASASQVSLQSQSQSQSTSRTTKRPKTASSYAPRYKSGGYAILMALHQRKQQIDSGQSQGLSYQMGKTELCQQAQPFCDASFTSSSTTNFGGGGGNQHYTAWNSVNTLIDKGLVIKMSNPPKYSLSLQGEDVASQLWLKSQTFKDNILPQSDVGHRSKQASVSSMSAPANKNGRPSIIQFQYWYLNEMNRRVKSRQQAKCDSKGSYLIEYHSSQSHHPFVVNIQKVTLIPDAAGLLVGYLASNLCMQDCPGLDVGSSSFGAQQTPSVKKSSTSSKEQQQQLSSSKPLFNTGSDSFKSPLNSNNFQSTPFSNGKQQVISTVEKVANQQGVRLSNIGLEKQPLVSREANYQLWPQPIEKDPLPISWTGPPLRLPAGSYDIVMLIDNREVKSQGERNFFIEELQKKVKNVQTRQLELGDIAWIARSKNQSSNGCQYEVSLDFLIERKRLDDLVSSIKDGRFFEQKSRLRKSSLKHLWYVVEEYNVHTVNDFGRLPLRCAMVETSLLHGISCKRTISIEDTCYFLVQMHNMVCKLYSKQDIYVIPPNLVTSETFNQFKAQCERRDRRPYHLTFNEFSELNSKSKTNTLKDLWFKQLMTVRGLSVDKASYLISKYPTLRSFTDALDSLPDNQTRIDHIKRQNSPIPRRALNDATIRKLVSLFYDESYQI
ncbi:hypothetical protein MP228_001187 [Amoeboaphelidium protococcarum]|nr:hypothetical protein MP228_001187 [Amoeboaphelidium protococcarum]